MSSEQRKTPLYDAHLELGAKMMDFAGWRLPMQYSGIREEHLAVRRSVGLFDVSHMGEILVSGPGAFEFLDYLLTRNMSGTQPGRALYSPMCNEKGGTVDDLLAYPLSEDRYLLVVNAANTAADLAHMRFVAKTTWAATGKPLPQIDDCSADYAQLALQGPNAKDILSPIIPETSQLRPFRFLQPASAPDWLVSRTGYTGEDGFEIYLPPAQARDLWQKLLAAGATPAGLGARDTLRLEAALPLYGHELSPDISPLDAGLERFVFTAKPQPGFVGQEALSSVGQSRQLIGLKALGRTIPRQGYPLIQAGKPIGTVTSGGYSPTLERGIALASVETTTTIDGSVLVRIRDKDEPFEVCSLPFVKRS
ncbi:MAG: glycine cleavage system aminomethyltransferase GcvT [Saccharofermentanales bacterium]|nr:glycine cleavage system aminomethyltransferase GcvT [Clostridiaceae bacterium]